MYEISDRQDKHIEYRVFDQQRRKSYSVLGTRLDTTDQTQMHESLCSNREQEKRKK